MKENIEKLYGNFVNSLNHCGLFLLRQRDNLIDYYLFEEFSIEVSSFLHPMNLRILLNEGIIDNEILELCDKLRKEYLLMESDCSDMLNVEAVKKSPRWRYILELSDKIKNLLYY